jgi:hypothetical protein
VLLCLQGLNKTTVEITKILLATFLRFYFSAIILRIFPVSFHTHIELFSVTEKSQILKIFKNIFIKFLAKIINNGFLGFLVTIIASVLASAGDTLVYL